MAAVSLSVRQSERQRGCAQPGDTGRELASSSGRTRIELLDSPFRLTSQANLPPPCGEQSHAQAPGFTAGTGRRRAERGEEVVLGLGRGLTPAAGRAGPGARSSPLRSYAPALPPP